MNNDNRTTKSQIRSQLRILWLHSRERSQAMKNNNYCCELCGVKQSKAKGKEQKLEIHHKEGVGNWDEIIDLIQEQLLCDPINLMCLCPECHDKITYNRT